MFFSSKILKSTFGGSSKLVSLGMMAVGIPFNFLPGVLKVSHYIITFSQLVLSLLLCFGVIASAPPLSLLQP